MAGNRYILAYGGADGDGLLFFVPSVGVRSRRFTFLSKASGTEDKGIEAIQSMPYVILSIFITFSTLPIYFPC